MTFQDIINALPVVSYSNTKCQLFNDALHHYDAQIGAWVDATDFTPDPWDFDEDDAHTMFGHPRPCSCADCANY